MHQALSKTNRKQRVMSSLRLLDASMDLYRKQGPPYSEECLNNTTLDCSHSVNNKCDACYIYRQDAFPFVNTFIFRVSASSTSPKHQLVSIRRLGHFFFAVPRHVAHKR